jgi:molybdopterin synthase sulfur carrier subunit
LARVVLIGNLAQLTGGVTEFQLPATSVKQLFQQLAELHPAIAPHLTEGVAVAIDGQIYQDALLEPIAPDSEVFLLPQIAGGAREQGQHCTWLGPGCCRPVLQRTVAANHVGDGGGVRFGYGHDCRLR